MTNPNWHYTDRTGQQAGPVDADFLRPSPFYMRDWHP